MLPTYPNSFHGSVLLGKGKCSDLCSLAVPLSWKSPGLHLLRRLTIVYFIWGWSLSQTWCYKPFCSEMWSWAQSVMSFFVVLCFVLFFNNKNMGYLQILGPFCFTQFAYSNYPTEPRVLFWIFVVKWNLNCLLNTQFDRLRFTRVAKKSVISVTVHIEMRGGCPCSNWNLKSRDGRKRKASSQLGYACFLSECFG